MNVFGAPAFHRISARIGVDVSSGPGIALWVAIVWLPPLILGGIAGLLASRPPEVSIFQDLPFHVRCLIAFPILLSAEHFVQHHLNEVPPIMLRRGMIREEAKAEFARIQSAIESVSGSFWAEAALLLFSILYVGQRLYIEPPGDVYTWKQIDSVLAVAAREWNRWLGLTSYYYIAARWIWALLLWAYFLFRVAKLKPDLEPQHPDQMGGLAFLVHRHLKFAFAATAISAVVSARIADNVIHGGVDVEIFLTALGVYLVVVELAILAPLIVFTPMLIKERREGMNRYGAFANVYVQQFERKWLGKNPESDKPLGTPDLQSLNDLDGSYSHQREMSVFLLKRHDVLGIAVTTCLPFLPLVFFKIPLVEILAKFAEVIL